MTGIHTATIGTVSQSTTAMPPGALLIWDLDAQPTGTTTTLTDQSGNGRHGTLGAGATNNASAIGGRKALSPGSSGGLTTEVSLGAAISGTVQMFVVMTRLSGSAPLISLRDSTSGGASNLQVGGRWQTGGLSLGSNTVGPAVLLTCAAPTAAGGTGSLRTNGASTASGTVGEEYPPNTVGAGALGVSSAVVAYVAIYANLPDPTRNTAEQYLMSKYGLS